MKYSGAYLNEISFPLGGIGTGSIGIAGNGRLTDFEIFNRPNKGKPNGYSHFAIKTVRDGKPIAYVLNGDLTKDLSGQYGGGFGFGISAATMAGFPHFKEVAFTGEFPIATLDFHDDGFPADIRMTAFNPLIPNDAENSSLPAAFFGFTVENTTDEPLPYTLALSFVNPCGKTENTACTEDGLHFLKLATGELAPDDIKYCDVTLATDAETVNTQSYWYRGAWQDAIVSFWKDFCNTQPLRERLYATAEKGDHGTLAATVTVPPHEKKELRFVLSWNAPNRYNDWSECKDEDGNHRTWKNYYATQFRDSVETAAYALRSYDDLYARTLRFKNALFASTMPKEVVDAAASNLAVLKSPTVLRLTDGSFYGWEGVGERKGSCEGTCQHVWNYAYALCFLFPELERSIRENEFRYCTDADGKMHFRMTLPAGREPLGYRACLDGQMGAVIKCYREWKLSGDDAWLRLHWDEIKRILEYAWSNSNPDRWDRDKDGVLEGRQHHTLDMEMFGPSSWLEGMYLAALKAASLMAEAMGDGEKRDEYRALFLRGREWTRDNLFNGSYFFHKVDLTDRATVDAFDASGDYWNEEAGEIKYQVANGSSIDQMLGQWHADILGLGDIFDPAQIDTALDAMMTHNYRPTMRGVTNPWRVFALNDEGGSLICQYPDGVKKPRIPIPYCEETMTGFEYSFAGLLCSRGRIDDGVRVTRAVRERYNGKNRNPWNEIECGSNYARSMASYALIPILSGFSFDLPNGHIGFDPYTEDGFCSVWSVGGAWGEIEVDTDAVRLTVIEGALSLRSFGVPFLTSVSSVSADGKSVAFSFENGCVGLSARVTDSLVIER